MSQFKFLKLEKTPGEKHLGIVTVKAYDKIILRYKIVQGKDGKGIFFTPPAYKMPSENGIDSYVSAFLIDSNSENEELMNLIKVNCKCILAPTSQSVFSSQENENDVPF